MDQCSPKKGIGQNRKELLDTKAADCALLQKPRHICGGTAARKTKSKQTRMFRQKSQNRSVPTAYCQLLRKRLDFCHIEITP